MRQRETKANVRMGHRAAGWFPVTRLLLRISFSLQRREAAGNKNEGAGGI